MIIRNSIGIGINLMKKLIMAICLMLILSSATGCAFTPRSEAQPPLAMDRIEQLGFDGGNIGAGGLICQGDDGYIYYRSERDGWKLYKAKPDGSSKKKVSDRVVENINVLGEWVYFIDHMDDNSIYKIRTDGTDMKKLVDGWCYNLYVAESGMYFDKRDEHNDSQIYAADLDGKNMVMLLQGKTVAYYYKGNIYYKGPQQLGVYNIAKNTEKILVRTGVHNVSIDDSGIYYYDMDKSEFRRMDLNGGGDSTLVRGGDFFNYHQGQLYYVGIGSNENGPCHTVNRLNIESGETTVLMEEANEYFDAHGNWLGITFKEWEEGSEKIDPSLIDKTDGSLKNGFNESVGYTYVAGEYPYLRGILQKSLLETGKLDCIARLDDPISIWD